MNVEEIRDLCVGFMGVTEETPFPQSPSTVVFKVNQGNKSKIFLIMDLDRVAPNRFINVKLYKETADGYKASYGGVKPGWHQDKRWWYSIHLDEDIPSKDIRDIICLSYLTVIWTNGIKINNIDPLIMG